MKLDHHRDQLLYDNEARVWTADEMKTPCEIQLRPEHSQEMQLRTVKNRVYT